MREWSSLIRYTRRIDTVDDSGKKKGLVDRLLLRLIYTIERSVLLVYANVQVWASDCSPLVSETCLNTGYVNAMNLGYI